LVVSPIDETDALRQIHSALFPETGARFSSGGVESDQTSIDGGYKDAPLRRRPFRRLRLEPSRNAARGHLGVMARQIDLRVVSPASLARGRIQRNDAIVGRAEVKRPVNEDRRRLEGSFLSGFVFILRFSSSIDPGDLKLADVLPVNLIERLVARTT
jgi:hypothetical protein